MATPFERDLEKRRDGLTRSFGGSTEASMLARASRGSVGDAVIGASGKGETEEEDQQSDGSGSGDASDDSSEDGGEDSSPSSPSAQQQTNVVSALSAEAMGVATQAFETLYAEHPLKVAKQASRNERRERQLISMSLVYGEIAFSPFKVVLDVLKRWHHVLTKPGGVFLDIGSGSGKAVFAAALLHDFDACYGIEVLGGLHAISQDVLQRWEKHIKPTQSMQKKRTRISFTHADALVYDWPPNADLIFLNSTCFGERLLHALARKLALCCKPGAIVITATHELPDAQNFEKLRQLTVTQEAWGDATWYLHRKKGATT